MSHVWFVFPEGEEKDEEKGLMEDEKCMCRVEKRKAMKKMKCLNDPEDERMQREKAWMEMIMIIQKQQQQQQEEEEEYEYFFQNQALPNLLLL